eukprot:GFUD01026657.1.p1 GENE.GFUD01026657.1~~GFUD01026657.1.p1  ORF type:complete len:341 (-),score=61.33 GFUD01026657.1:68-1090(-)
MDVLLLSIRYLFVEDDMKKESRSQPLQCDKKTLEEFDGEVIASLTSMLGKEKESSRIHEEEIRCLKLEIEDGKLNMKEVIDKHKHIVDQLKEKVECPVCMEIPRMGPVHVCPNGHFVCNKCKKGSCPTCRVGMGDGKSLLAVTVIENIEHKCKFDDCKEFFDVDKLEGHERICKHRTVSCPYDECSQKIALSKLVDHLNKETCSSNLIPTVIASFSKLGRVGFRVGNNSRSDLNWVVRTFSYEDQNFAVIAKIFDNFFYFTMVMFESENECSKYNIEMEVYECGSSSQDSESSFQFCGKPCSIDEDKDNLKYNGLAVHNTGMEKILRKSNDRFNVSVRIA